MAAASGVVCPQTRRFMALFPRLTSNSKLWPQMSSSFDFTRHNSNTASITRPTRNCYTRTYPTLLVYPDGSTINIRYKEPRQIIRLPLDFSKLSDVEKKVVLSKRKPKEELEVEEDFDDTFDASEYSKYWKT